MSCIVIKHWSNRIHSHTTHFPVLTSGIWYCRTWYERKALQFDGSTSKKLLPPWPLRVCLWWIMYLPCSTCNYYNVILWVTSFTNAFNILDRFLSTCGKDSRAVWQIPIAGQIVKSIICTQAQSMMNNFLLFLVYFSHILISRRLCKQVLIFSQWTKVLDIMDYYFSEKGFEVCRIDGSVNLDKRKRQVCYALPWFSALRFKHVRKVPHYRWILKLLPILDPATATVLGQLVLLDQSYTISLMAGVCFSSKPFCLFWLCTCKSFFQDLGAAMYSCFHYQSLTIRIAC